ncbi:hypothetical protein ACFQZT_06015 [Paenibacillus sp. GCM10027628]|uniref:hypothetical protein n=1 Tax=Paenibacillus sp. GCM10027628 TaxID=3273413 RepID=UPI003640B052
MVFHFSSRHFVSKLGLSSGNVIDACVYRLPDGRFRMWYKDEGHHSHMYAADSSDLYHWEVKGPVITVRSQEGPNVFRLGGWERNGLILDQPGKPNTRG